MERQTTVDSGWAHPAGRASVTSTSRLGAARGALRLAGLGLFACAAWTLLVSCGRESDQVVIKYVTRDPQPTGKPALPSARSLSTPTPSPAQPSAEPSAPTPSPRPSPSAQPGELTGGPFFVFVKFDGRFEPLVNVEVRSPEGKLLVADQVSKDGYGRKQGLKFLPPGRYNLKIFTEVTPEYPVYHKNVTIFDGVRPEFTVGQVQFAVPEEGSWQIDRGIQVDIVDAVTMKPVWSGLLLDMVSLSLYRDRFPRSLILPLGKYAFGVKDVNEKDDVKIVVPGGGEGLVKIDLENNVFELTATAPFAQVSLEAILSTPALEQRRRDERSGRSRFGG